MFFSFRKYSTKGAAHAPLKSKTFRGNNVSFINKIWRKTIYERTCLKNIYNKERTRDNWSNYKRRHLCTNLRKKSMKHHFRNVSEGKHFSSNAEIFRKLLNLSWQGKVLSQTATYLLKRQMKLEQLIKNCLKLLKIIMLTY